MFRFFDAHAHVQFAAYDDDRDAVIGRALQDDVAMINVGTNRETSEAAVRLAEKYPEGVYATVGIHPTHASGSSFHDKQELSASSFAKASEDEKIFDREFYKSLTIHKKVVAIGECGLDYFRVTSDELRATSEKQKEVFLQHIELAHEAGRPLMIHCRNAFFDLISVLKANNSKPKTENPGVIHFMSGTKEDAKKLLDLGFYFTFGGVITFTRDYDEVVRYIPTDRILSETDAPYVTPAPYRGKRNEPVYVIEVVKRLADLKSVGFEEMAEQVLQNARKIFPSITI